MNKKFSFSTGASVEFADDKIIVVGYEELKLDVNDIESVFYKKPGFLSKGYVSIGGEYVDVKKKDVPQVMELLNCFEEMGIFACYYRGECSDNYLEADTTVGGACSSYRIKNGQLYYLDFYNDVYEVDLSEIKCIWVAKGYLAFTSDDIDLSNIVTVKSKDGEEEALNVSYKKKYFDAAIKFANDVANLGGDIVVKGLDE